MSQHIDRFTLDAYVEQVLPAAERRALEAHVTICPTCQARLANAKQLIALLYDLPREMPASSLAARINATLAAQCASATPRWMRALAPAAFAFGLVLLIPAAPRWLGWLGTATEQLPTGQAGLAWLITFLANPAASLDSLLSFAEQLLMAPAGEMDVMLTSAMVVLTLASLAGLAQLLGSERPRGAAPNVLA